MKNNNLQQGKHGHLFDLLFLLSDCAGDVRAMVRIGERATAPTGANKTEIPEQINAISETKRSCGSLTHVNGWSVVPAVYMSQTAQNVRRGSGTPGHNTRTTNTSRQTPTVDANISIASTSTSAAPVQHTHTHHLFDE